MKVLLCIAAFPVALVGWQWWGDRSTEQALVPVVSEIAGRSVEVDCQGFWASLLDIQWRDGEVRFSADGTPEARIFLTRDTCRTLRDFRGRLYHPEVDCLRDPNWTADPPRPPPRACYERRRPRCTRCSRWRTRPTTRPGW